MRLAVDPELVLFAASVRGALEGWEPPLEPVLGTFWDERDEARAERIRALGWDDLGADASLLGPAVAGAFELGRAVAPLCLLDDATLGGSLCLGRRVRHGLLGRPAAVPGPGETLVSRAFADGLPEPTLDGSGVVREVALGEVVAGDDAAAQRLRAWGAATLGYLAGLADAVLERALAHVRSREQFGAPLAALPAVQGRLAEAALLRDGLLLVAWEAASEEPANGLPRDGLAWGGPAACEVARQALQVHGGIGFALEGGIHRHVRRAKAAQVWIDAVLATTAPATGAR